jgi:methylated-DNA-[protein]-cysteine S-methyltransferase
MGTQAAADREHTVVTSPLGELTLVRDGAAMAGLYFPHHWYMPTRAALGPRTDRGFGEITAQLEQYFAGHRATFDVPVQAAGDGFQRRVRDLICAVPYGQTTTYGALARALGSQVTAQQAGAAVGRNPLCILIPCHRVVGANGKLTGYAGGLPRKRALLELEREHTDAPAQVSLLPGTWPAMLPGS